MAETIKVFNDKFRKMDATITLDKSWTKSYVVEPEVKMVLVMIKLV